MFLAALIPLIQNFADACKPTFFGLIPWYQYLQLNAAPDCSVTSFNVLPNGAPSDVPLVALAILDDLVRVAALVAVGFVVYGGIQYVTSQGAPDATKKAQQTIINALIGVAIAVAATGIVTFIGGKLGSN